MKKVKISVKKTPTYNSNDVTEAVNFHFESLDAPSMLKGINRVVIKPNLLMKRSPEQATTTHPSIVEAVIIKLKQLGITDITIADSPGGPFTHTALKGIYAQSGMEEVAKRQEVKLNYDTGSADVKSKNGKKVSEFRFINPIVNAEFIINICKFKTHAMTGISGGTKNLFGCIPGLLKPEMHMRFPEKADFGEMLVDLAETVSPQLTIVDAVVSMEGDGPTNGDLRTTGVTLACTNTFDLDIALCKMVDLNPENIEMVKASIDRNLTADEIEYVGDALPVFKDFKKPESRPLDFSGHIPKFISKLALKYTSPKPKIKIKKCVGCGKCAESCPAATIKIVDKKAKIDYSNCIKCFCCHEMCKFNAIKIKKFKFFNF